MNKKLLSFSVQELIAVTLIGGAPMFLTYELGGGDVEILKNTIKSLLPNSFQLWYALILSVPFFLIVILDWYFLIFSAKKKKIIHYLKSILSKVSDGFLGIFRATTGVLLYFPLFWLCYDYESFNYSKVSYFHIYGFMALAECAFLSWLQDQIKKLTYNHNFK